MAKVRRLSALAALFMPSVRPLENGQSKVYQDVGLPVSQYSQAVPELRKAQAAREVTKAAPSLDASPLRPRIRRTANVPGIAANSGSFAVAKTGESPAVYENPSLGKSRGRDFQLVKKF